MKQLTFEQIGVILGISKQAAHQLWKKGRITISFKKGQYFITRYKGVTYNEKSVYTVDEKKDET